MHKDIKAYVKACVHCSRAKAFRRTHAGMPKRQLFMKRSDCQFWDFIGPFVSTNGMMYIAHGTNGCTGFNYGIAVPNKETLTAATAMHQTFMQCGWPDKIVTDQGGEFASKLQEALREEFGYQLVRCCPRSPTGNTFVEGRHRQMNACLKIAVRLYGQTWPFALPYIIWALNVRPYRDTEVTPYAMEYGYEPPTMANVVYADLQTDDVNLPLDLKKLRSPEDWLRTTNKNIRDAIAVTNHSKIRTMRENERRENDRFYNVTLCEGDLCFVHRPITKKGQTSRLLYQNIGPFEVMGPACPPNVDGSCNAYKLRCLATDRTSSFNVKDIHPYLKKDERKGNEGKVQDDEEGKDEERDEDEEIKFDDFDPVEGDFLLFANFQNVEFHLIQVVERPTSESIKFIYYGTTATSRRTGWAKVWTHDSKQEVHSNSKVMLGGYKVVEHTIPIEEVCQKVIFPVRYKSSIKWYFKLKDDAIADVLRYNIG